MNHSVRELCEKFDPLVVEVCGPDDYFSRIDNCSDFSDDSLIFVGEASQLEFLQGTGPAVVVTSQALAPEIPDFNRCVIVVTDVRLAQALIKQHYADYDASDREWEAVHSSAVVHPSVRLDAGVRVGPNSVIGADVSIGARTQIRANCVIERGVKIGADCIVNNLVNIGQGCVLGDRVIVRPGAIIGNEGFGFAQDDNKHYQRVPHTGIVVIEDDVQVGSNCNIDRATYGQTVIKRGVKIDALCHIAHNCIVDEDALFVAQSGVAGSCRIGKRVICSGQTGMLDHKTVADDAILVHRCGVTEDIPSAGMWAGTPPKPFKEYVSNLTAGKRLEKKIAKLEAEIDAIKSSP